jgi:hypothetical protein
MKGALVMERLTLKRLRERALRGVGRYIKKGFGYGNLYRGPFTAGNLEGGSYTGKFERFMKEGSSNGASLFEGLHEEDLQRGLL